MIRSARKVLLLLTFSREIPSTDAFSINSNPDRQNFHQVLQRVGKTVFRPGGSEATDTLHGWVSLDDDSHVLELASGLGTGGMALAERFHCHVTLTDNDEQRLEKAKANASKRGLQDLVDTKILDMNHLEEGLDDNDHYDVAIIEASLTHFVDAQKLAVIQNLCKHADELLLHEVVLLADEDAQEIKQNVGKALAIGFNPMSIEAWTELLSKCGFAVSNIEHGSLRLLNPKSLVRDEGIRGAARIAWNLATKKDLRDRIVQTKSVIDSYRDCLGYMILRVERKKEK